MNHVKFNGRPFNRSFNNLLDDIFTASPVLFRNDFNQHGNGNIPVNVTESKEGYTIDVVAPGFEKADFKINLDQNILTISLEKKDEVADETKRTVRKEYTTKSFKRSFNLDDKINVEAIDAKYVNGILIVQLPKKEEVKIASKDIAIQ